MNDLKIGVIGSGGRGNVATHAHSPETGVTVVATCDTRPEQWEQDKKDYGADIFCTADYRELLQRDLDAVFVTIPDFLHEEVAVAAVQACPAVYLEKPMAITTAGADRILDAAMRSGCRLYLGHNMRHMPFVVKLKQLIDDGAIGEVRTIWCRHFVGYGGDFYFKDWHSERRNVTSLLLQKGSHDIDVIHWLAGSYTNLVTGMGNLSVYNRVTDTQEYPPQRGVASDENWPPLSQTRMSPVIDVEDLSMVQMRLDNEVLATYHECHYSPDYWRNYTIIGTEGRLENFGNSGPGTVIKLWNKRVLGYNAEADHNFEIPPVEGGHGGADDRIVAEFVRFAREGGKTNTSPVAARYSVATGVAAAHSLRNGSIPVEVPRVAPQVSEYFGN